MNLGCGAGSSKLRFSLLAFLCIGVILFTQFHLCQNLVSLNPHCSTAVTLVSSSVMDVQITDSAQPAPVTLIATASPVETIAARSSAPERRREESPRYGANVLTQAAAQGYYLPGNYLDESQSFGVKRLPKNFVLGNVLDRRQVEECLAGHRIVAVGNSHLHYPFQLMILSLSLRVMHTTSLIKGEKFSLRNVVDTAVFSNIMSDSVASILLRRSLNNASESELEAFRHDVVFVNRGVWDIYWYNTNISVVGQEFYGALKELFEKWVKRRGGKIVVMPMWSTRSKSQCLSLQRVELVRLALFAAVQRFAAERGSDVVVTTPDKIDGDKVNILIFDIYDHVAADEHLLGNDGHHLSEKGIRLVAVAWLRSIMGCKLDLSSGKADEAMISAFLSSPSQKFTTGRLAAFWENPVPYPRATEPCNCLSSSVGSVHPGCDMPDILLSRKRRHNIVQQLLQHGIEGATEAQVHELVNFVCREQEVVSRDLQKHFRRCREVVGAKPRGGEDSTGRVSWVASPNMRLPMKTPCLCKDATTNLHNVTSQRCVAAEAEWQKNKASCIYVNPDANFDEG